MGGYLSTRWADHTRYQTLEEAANALRVRDVRLAIQHAAECGKIVIGNCPATDELILRVF